MMPHHCMLHMRALCISQLWDYRQTGHIIDLAMDTELAQRNVEVHEHVSALLRIVAHMHLIECGSTACLPAISSAIILSGSRTHGPNAVHPGIEHRMSGIAYQ